MRAMCKSPGEGPLGPRQEDDFVDFTGTFGFGVEKRYSYLVGVCGIYEWQQKVQRRVGFLRLE